MLRRPLAATREVGHGVASLTRGACTLVATRTNSSSDTPRPKEGSNAKSRQNSAERKRALIDKPARSEDFTEPDPGARAELIGKLFREHNRALIKFLMNRLRSSDEAADVAQEAYARMLQLHSPGTVSFLRAFLFKTAANIAIDRLRSRKAETRRAENPFLGRIAEELSTEQSICDAEELRLTTAYIEELPSQHREALLLSRFEPLSTAEIAKRMGISERTVQHYIVESLIYIRSRLERGARPKPAKVEE
jgi:RNA polymerase sigma factor (sigma-70 family)